MGESDASAPRTFKLTIAYDGTGLVGWQRQPEGTSVQGLLDEGLQSAVVGPLLLGVEEGSGGVEPAVAAVAGSAFYGVLALIERRLTFWHPSYRSKSYAR